MSKEFLADVSEPLTADEIAEARRFVEDGLEITTRIRQSLVGVFATIDALQARLAAAEAVVEAARVLIDEADDATDDCLLVRQSDVRALRAALDALPTTGETT